MDEVSRTGGSRGALEYGKFRTNAQGNTVVAVADDSDSNVATAHITASGNVELISVPSDGKAIRIKGFQISATTTDPVSISFREGTDGELKFTTYMVVAGAFVSRDLSHAWALTAGKALNVHASASCNVYVTVEVEEPAKSEAESKSLVDTLAIAETLANTVEFSLGLSDSQTLVDSIETTYTPG